MCLSKARESADDSVYYDGGLISLLDLVEAIEAYGYPLKHISGKDMRQFFGSSEDKKTEKVHVVHANSFSKLEQTQGALIDEKHPLFVFKSVLSRGGYMTMTHSPHDPNTRRALSLVTEQLSRCLGCPAVSATTIAKFLSHFVAEGLIDPPRSST